MKTLFILLFCLFPLSSVWLTDMEAARRDAVKQQRPILLYFSGSDWCGHCIRMQNEIFSTAPFERYAAQKLVLLNADFPRQEKNKLDEASLLRNNKLSQQYNPESVFPTLLLLRADGTVLYRWEGFPPGGCTPLLDELDRLIAKNRQDDGRKR